VIILVNGWAVVWLIIKRFRESRKNRVREADHVQILGVNFAVYSCADISKKTSQLAYCQVFALTMSLLTSCGIKKSRAAKDSQKVGRRKRTDQHQEPERSFGINKPGTFDSNLHPIVFRINATF
jgi:hypothetical protein